MKLNKLMVMGVVFILIIASLSAIWMGGRDKSDEQDEEPVPESVLEIGPNVRLTSVPQPNNEPHIAVNPTDPLNIVAGGNDYGSPLEDAWCGAYATVDGGKNWTRTLIPGYYDMGDPKPGEPLWGYKGTGDPVLAFDSKGTCYLAGIAFKRYPLTPGRFSGIFVARSDDKGFTWDVSMVIASATIGTFHDKEWIAVDPNNGNVYVTWTAFNFYSVSSLLFSKSTDGGQTWSRPVVISDLLELELQVQGSAIVVDKTGGIHVVWIDFAQETVRYASSTDEGNSWSAPKNIAPANEIPYTLSGGEYRTPTLMALAIDNSDSNYSGSLYATWPDMVNGNADILVTISRDKGATWSPPITVNNDNTTNSQFFPGVCVSPNGWVHMIFYDRRDDFDDVLLHAYYAQSRDGGENWTIQVNVSSVSFDGDLSYTDGAFIGDYLGIASNDTVAHMVWCDTRDATDSNPESEIYYGSVKFL